MSTGFRSSPTEEKNPEIDIPKEHYFSEDNHQLLPPPHLNEEVFSDQWHETMSTHSYRSSVDGDQDRTQTLIPHRGSLCRVEQETATNDSSTSPLSYRFTIEIVLENGDNHELWFERQELELMSRLFSILDTESRGSVGRSSLQEFVTLRCPVFWRRDEDLRHLDSPADINSIDGGSPTFDEVWRAVASCSKKTLPNLTKSTLQQQVELGVEGWMVFCRFIALAQYLEAKRQFSARHLQQTMRHRNSPRGSEMVVVDVPPPSPPTPLLASELAEYERKGKGPLPLPELDLDHSLVAAHEAFRRRTSTYGCAGTVTVSLFGSASESGHHQQGVSSSSASGASTPILDFAVTYTPHESTGAGTVVRRSFSDMKWLNDTFTSHKVLGGTLCGRILPPFPGSSGNVLAAHLKSEEGSLKSALGSSKRGTMAAASAGVDILSSAAKSIWGSYVSSSLTKSSSTPRATAEQSGAATTVTSSSKSGKKIRPHLSLPENYYNPNSPVWKARQLERYLNYLLEHPALSTSFPLNTILKASQSGLEAAKLSIADHAKTVKPTKSYIPQLVEGNFPIPFWSQSSSSSSQPTNLSWVRTAAQAAMALKLHGILETTGLPSASARLQHASLPTFDNSSSRKGAWADEEESQRTGKSSGEDRERSPSRDSDDPEGFEHGVVHVESELKAEVEDDGDGDMAGDDDGYDLLPLPVPAPERRILCAGSGKSSGHQATPDAMGRGGQSPGLTTDETKQPRFHYGRSHAREHLDSSDSSQLQSAFLGEFSVDDNIDKLREVIGSVDNTLSRCLSASAGIGSARRKRYALHLELVRGFDSWEGMRGQFITQRAVLNGVAVLEQSRNITEESDLNIIDDVSWQTSLARSAVSAAEDVRSTVRAARTAANAKAAADAAAFSAQNACDNGNFPSIDEARAAQTRSSVAQSHAIHATVVEHEANTAKKRAALALAHDVKCWNVHRKRELLRTCLAHARSQHNASHRAAEAWSCLRDGFVGPSSVPYTESKRSSMSHDRDDTKLPSRRHSDYEGPAVYPKEAIAPAPVAPPPPPPRPPLPQEEEEEEEPKAIIYQDASPDAEGAISEPSIVPVDHDLLGLAAPPTSFDDDFATPHDPFSDALQDNFGDDDDDDDEQDDETPFALDDQPNTSATSGESEDNVLSASMQSLVDGLMSWGGQFDAEDDLALPMGMAADIAFEESGASSSANADTKDD